MKHLSTLALAGVLLCGLGAEAISQTQQAPMAPPTPSAEATLLPVAVSPSDPHIRYIGRFDTSDAAGPRCAWTASSVELRVQGSALNVRLADGSSNRYEVFVDGRPASVLATQTGTHLYRVFQAPQSGRHTLSLVKRTEAFFGTTQFQVFQLPQGGKLLALPPRPPRRIEVIGDSISCGYGNEAKNQYEHFSADTENGAMSYGAVAARDLDAEYVCIAWSGRKMWPNNTMPEIYDRTLPLDPKSRWDFSRWTPQAVVINLSTNDFNGGAPDRQGWTAAYEAFLTRVRSRYPKAILYCATSPMMGGKSYDIAKDYLTQIVQDKNTAGDKNVRLLVFETQDAKNGFGADWHPSLKTDAVMADKMATTLGHDLGWKIARQEQVP